MVWQPKGTVNPLAGPGQNPGGSAGGRTTEALKIPHLLSYQKIPFVINYVFCEKDLKQLR